MSSGPNQHYLPQFLQKPFGIRPKRHKIWVFGRNIEPEEDRIKNVGASDYFYSGPTADGSRTLDDAITDTEDRISKLLAAVRLYPIGSTINAASAAEIVNHLVPRTAHVRVSVERGLHLMARGIETIISDEERLQTLMGLGDDEPNDGFRDNLAQKINELGGFERLGLPRPLVERFAFFMAKENFTTLAGEVLPTIRAGFAAWLDKSNSFVRDGHNDALTKLLTPTPRLKLLEGLTWAIFAGPPEGAILPDCVALAVKRDGQTVPAMLADWAEIDAIVLPVSPDKLLVGMAKGIGGQLPDFNEQAARVSHDFFLAPTKSEYFESLHKRLGERSMQLIEEGVRGAMEPYLAMVPKPRDDDTPLFPLDIVRKNNEPWQYELSLLGCGETESAQELLKAVQGIVTALTTALPLNRLDGITIASDYRAAVASIDRGYDGATTPDTAPEEIGQGIARTISVYREGRWKDRIVLDAGVAFGLLAEESETVEWGVYIFVRQLAEVAVSDMIDRHLPGVWMQPIANPLQAFLYPTLHPAIFAYLGSHISAGFGDPPNNTDLKRELFITALRDMRTAGLSERLDYRHHADVDRLLRAVMPRISYALQFGAELLGHCAAVGSDPLGSDGELAKTLEEVGLLQWFPIFRDRLERLRMRMGLWDSFDEFLALNIHVERLMWQLGMLPWDSPQGLRIEVPLGTDIDKLV